MKSNFSKTLAGILIIICISSMTLPMAVYAVPMQQASKTPAVNREPKHGYNPETGRLSFIGNGSPIRVPNAKYMDNMTTQESAMNIAVTYGTEFGLRNPSQELKLSKSHKDSNGNEIVHYQQMHNGIPVIAGELVVNVNTGGEMLSMSGEVSPDLSLDTKPSIQGQVASKTALSGVATWHNIDKKELTATTPELWIFDESLLTASTRPIELVWRLEVTAKDATQPIHEMVLVNAKTGEISFHVNQVDTEFIAESVVQNSFPSIQDTDVENIFSFQQVSLPLYFDLVVDEQRGWIYGSDSTGNKIDVISTSNLELIKSFSLVGGANPKGIALSPNGNELAIAQYGASSILFINPDTGEAIASVTPNATTSYPYDLVYGRSGRLYSSGNGQDYYIHVIDSNLHTEISRSPNNSLLSSPHLAISSDKNWLYASRDSGTDALFKYDISTDIIPDPVSTSTAVHDFSGGAYVLSPDDSKIFTNWYQVWNSELSAKIGETIPRGTPAILPNHDAIAIAVDNSSGHDELAFISIDDFYTLTTFTLPFGGIFGALVANPTGTKLYVSSSGGFIAIDLVPSLPGIPVPLPSGPLPYYDLVIDEQRGVIYGSDFTSNKIDVISIDTLQIIKNFRFPNGSGPRGMALDPDGSELAVALVNAGGLWFLNPDTGETIASLLGRQSDVIYGRSNRMYTIYSNYIDVIDTSTHTKINSTPYAPLSASYLTISSDKNTLFANSTTSLYRVDISTDTLPAPIRLSASQFSSYKSALLVDDTKIFTDYHHVWSPDFKTQLGSIEPGGTLKRTLAYLPNHDLIAIGTDNSSGNDEIWFASTEDFYTLSKYTLPTAGSLGLMISSSDGNILYADTGSGITALDLTSALPGEPVTLPSGALPYYDVVLDESRGVLYGSDLTGNKIDVISTDTLQVVRSFRLVNGAKPKAIALSPNDGELAIAQSSASSILFLNPDTGDIISKLIPDTPNKIPTPADIIYGRAGRLYSTGNDYIHVIDTLSHNEISKSATVYGSNLAISSDNNYLYTNDLKKFDVSTDTVLAPIKSASFGSTSATSVLLVDDSKIFTDKRNVWNSDLSLMSGVITPLGIPINLPNHNVIAVGVDNTSGNDSVSFVGIDNFYTISTYTLPTSGALGPSIATADGTKLYVNTSNGFLTLNLTPSLPGTPTLLPSGPLPYFDLIADEARGVFYGSDSTGNKIDVISVSTQEVIKSFRLANGAIPRGMALSPDGSELAIAQLGVYSVLFLNPETGDQIAVIPSLVGGNKPWDVIYGRPGRLYVSGATTPNIHIIDAVTHAEINKFGSFSSGNPYLAITSDKKKLYVNGSSVLNLFDVSSDTAIRIAYNFSIQADTYLLLSDDSKIFTNKGQVWSSDLLTNLGSTGTNGGVMEIPGLGLIAVLSTSNPGLLTFVKSSNYVTTSTSFIPSITSTGMSLSLTSGDELFINTNVGIKALNIATSAPNSITASQSEWYCILDRRQSCVPIYDHNYNGHSHRRVYPQFYLPSNI